MTDSQKRILEMLAEKKITVEEAERLLSLTGNEEGTENKSYSTAPERKSVVFRRGSLQRLSHWGIAGSADCSFGSSVKALRAAANCSAVALG